jgi:diguanylate cyclase (GGDEF)-like protein/PAS domain S-box-containing protein
MSELPTEENHPNSAANPDWLGILQDAYLSGKSPESWLQNGQNTSEWLALVENLLAIRSFVLRIAEGDLSAELKVKGQLAGSLKTLQANLRHLTWQVQQVASGDLTQQVSFMGDFSAAFNQMTASLDKARTELRASEARYRLLAKNAADVIWILDLSGHYTYMSPSVERLRGFTVEEALHQSIEDSFTPDSSQLIRQQLIELNDPAGAAIRSGEPSILELEQTRKNGSPVWTEVTVSTVKDEQEKLIGLQGASRDIGERRRAQKAERDQRLLAEALRDTAAALNSAKSLDEVFTTLLENIGKVVPHDAVQIFLVDNEGNAYLQRAVGGQILENDAQKDFHQLRLPVSSTPNLLMMDRSGEPCLVDDLDDFPWVRNPTSSWAKSHLGAPIRVKGVTVGFLVLLSAMRAFFDQEHLGRIQAFADQAAVAVEKANLFEQLNQLATIDSLTQIPNRRHFFNMAETELVRSTRYNHPLSAMMMDIDHFKQVNDTYGHTIGDQVLQEVSRRCQETLRANDLMGRYGGEEFAFVLPETDLDAGVKVADRLRKLIASKPFVTRVGEIKVTVSIGIAGFKRDIPSARALLDQADQALFMAKQTGRNRVSKF